MFSVQAFYNPKKSSLRDLETMIRNGIQASYGTRALVAASMQLIGPGVARADGATILD
jgi:hypothetical protein